MNCDYWEILEIATAEETFQVVLGERKGGYLDSDYWKRSSPIKKFEKTRGVFTFTTQSGNKYTGIEERKGLHLMTSGVYDKMLEGAEKGDMEIRKLTLEEVNSLCE